MSSDHNTLMLIFQIRRSHEPSKIITRINWIQCHQFANKLPFPLPEINSTNDIDLLVEIITSEIKSAVDRATTKKAANEFYELEGEVPGK